MALLVDQFWVVGILPAVDSNQNNPHLRIQKEILMKESS